MVYANLLYMKGGDNCLVLVVLVSTESNGDDTDIALDEEDRENFPLDKDDLAPDRAYEDTDIEESTPRSEEAEFRRDELDKDCRLLKW